MVGVFSMRTYEQNTVTTDIIKCDDCGARNTRTKQCHFCGKDVCYLCAYLTDFICDLRCNGAYDCDRPHHVCKSCWNKGEEIRNKIMDIREKAEKDEEQLMSDWHNICTKVTT